MNKFKLFAALLLLVLPLGIFAQQGNGAGKYAQIKGTVTMADPKGEPVGFATVHLLPQDVYTTTEMDGTYFLKNIEPGATNISIQFIGMETIDTLVNLAAGKEYVFNFTMHETNFRLDEVTVLAEQSKAGEATASNISRQAIDHLQASTIKDVMQLLPGASLQNSNMSVANNIYIRTIAPTGTSRSATTATDDAHANMNSLGTAVIMDGAALSNNANMQLLSATMQGENANVGVGATPAAGVDLRGISTDNIESVEVIRGIPSAQYGDLTSGAVIIKTKAGKEPLRIKANLNPYTYSLSASKGMQLGEKGGAFSISGDYAYDARQQEMAHQYYQRFTLRGLWTKTFFDLLTTNTSLDLKYRKDTREKNPDDERSQIAYGAEEKGFRFNSNGSLSTPELGWLKRFSYTLSFTYTDKQSYRESMLSNAYAPYLMSSTDGAILSSIAGLKIYDKQGNEITNIPVGEEGYYGTYLPYSYFSRYDIYGKELNFQGSIKAHFNKRWEKTSNSILVGFDYKLDGNLGKGTVYNITTPPQSNSSSSAYRPRAFKDIPFINQTSVYVEDVFSHEFGRNEFKLTAGARFDQINSKSILTPRFNASFEIVPERLYLRGGWGVLAKAPTSLYLYPQDAYYEFVNYNTLGDEKLPADQQLLLGTTRVFKTENPDLKVARNTKSEVGFDFKFNHKKMGLSVTGYYEELKDGYSMSTDLYNGYHLVPYITYKNLQKDENGCYTLEVDQTHNVFVNHSTPMNSLSTINKGIEYELNLGRIDAIRTSINVNGAYMHVEKFNNNYSYSSATGNLEHHIGVYEKGVQHSFNEMFNTTFRFTHNIPQVGFAITLSAQANWFTKTWTEYGNDTMFEKFISYKDFEFEGKTYNAGGVYDFNPAMKDLPEFAKLFDTPNERRFIKEKYNPYVIFNLNVSKEIGDWLTASFFANNIFNTRPLYERKMYPGSYIELGIPTFFGFDLKLNIR
ncbi:MAG: TonB-dependent receptor [Bacteroidales bacterium]|nr:TonB-dependent receptor [Bacteroidales bacterium]